MSKQIKNRTNRPVVVRLASGKYLHLGPQAMSNELPDWEVNEANSAKVKKLVALRTIAVSEASTSTPQEPASTPKSAPKPG